MFNFLGKIGDMTKMAAAAKRMQDAVKAKQKELSQVTVEGESGGGLVRTESTATGDLKSVYIDQELINEGKKQIIQDLVLAAVRDVLKKAAEHSRDELKKISSEFQKAQKMIADEEKAKKS